MRFFYLLLTFLLWTGFSYSQNTFQKKYDSGRSTQAYSACMTNTGGVLMVGVTQTFGTDRVFLSMVSCTGEIEWFKTYGASSSINNVSPTVIETTDGHYLLAYNTGTFQNYDILLVKLDAEGNTIWQRLMDGNRDDMVNDVVETNDGGFLLVGTTNSFGQDVSGINSYRDVYALRLDADGNMLWGKTFGNKEAIDEAWGITKTSDGQYAITGRYIHNEAFYVLLMKMDDAGEATFMKVFGAGNHRNYGFDIIETQDGNLVITGMTTLNKENHQSSADAFLIKTNPQGDTLWTRSFAGSQPDGSDIGSAVIELEDGSLVMSMATQSFPLEGFVYNKHFLLQTDGNGDLMKSTTYVNTSAHYPTIHQRPGLDGYLMAGFSNFNSLDFKPHITLLNSSLESGCTDLDHTGLTIEQNPQFEVATPDVKVGDGFTLNTSNTEFLANFVSIETLCENIESEVCLPLSTSVSVIGPELSVGEITPNPALDDAFIDFHLLQSGQLETSIYTQSGVLVDNRIITIPAGNTRQQISLEGIPNGLYLVQFKTGKRAVTRKLLVMQQ